MVLIAMEPALLREFAKRQTYLAIDSTGSSIVFASLRDMEKELKVDHSTLSKKLKATPNGDVFTSRSTGLYYFVKKVGNNQDNSNAVHRDQSQSETQGEYHA